MSPKEPRSMTVSVYSVSDVLDYEFIYEDDIQFIDELNIIPYFIGRSWDEENPSAMFVIFDVKRVRYTK